MNKTYTCEFTLEQARALSTACEILARLGMGQFRASFDFLPIKSDVNWNEWHNDLDAIGAILSSHMEGGIDGWNSSLGIYNEKTPLTSKRAWDINQALRHHLAWDQAVEQGLVESVDSPRNWETMLGLNYDTPFKVTKEPLPTIKTNEA